MVILLTKRDWSIGMDTMWWRCSRTWPKNIGHESNRKLWVTAEYRIEKYSYWIRLLQYWDTIIYSFVQSSRYSNVYNILQPEALDLDSYREYIEQTHVSSMTKTMTSCKFNLYYCSDSQSNSCRRCQFQIARIGVHRFDCGFHVNGDALDGETTRFWTAHHVLQWQFGFHRCISVVRERVPTNEMERIRKVSHGPTWTVYCKLNIGWVRMDSIEYWVDDNFLFPLWRYVRRADNFYDALILNAGHMVPTDQPLAAFQLIDRFINDKL